MWDDWFMSTTHCIIVTTRCGSHGTSTTAFNIVSDVSTFLLVMKWYISCSHVAITFILSVFFEVINWRLQFLRIRTMSLLLLQTLWTVYVTARASPIDRCCRRQRNLEGRWSTWSGAAGTRLLNSVQRSHTSEALCAKSPAESKWDETLGEALCRKMCKSQQQPPTHFYEIFIYPSTNIQMSTSLYETRHRVIITNFSSRPATEHVGYCGFSLNVCCP